MGHKRFTSVKIEEGVDEGAKISVPGIGLFRANGLPVLLEGGHEVGGNTSGNAGGLTANPFAMAFAKKGLSPAPLPSSGLNISLLLNKFPWWYIDEQAPALMKSFGEFKLNKNGNKISINGGKPETFKRTHDYKRELLGDCVHLGARRPANYCEHKARHFSAPDGLTVSLLPLKTVTRLVVGLSGSASVLETAIELHPYFGFPVIPGSAIKGVTRHYCEYYMEEKPCEADLKAIFGHKPASADDLSEGGVVFYDAWPVWPDNSGQLLEVDVMTPHYSKYYGEGSAVWPTDNDSPNIIHFLAVGKGVEFTFAVRPSSSILDAGFAAHALRLVREAVTSIGVGAKTGSSYGYFR